jgi:hypothetical protein
MTAYRQRALPCAAILAQGPRHPRDLKAHIPDADLAWQRLRVVRARRARGLHLGRVWPSRAPALPAAGTADRSLTPSTREKSRTTRSPRFLDLRP